VGVAYLRHNQSCAEGKLQQENLAEEKALAASFQDSAHKRRPEICTAELKIKVTQRGFIHNIWRSVFLIAIIYE
jgi:hypothetical protein